MPRVSKPKKDVEGCEKPRGGACNCRAADVRMGEPTGYKPEYHECGRASLGNEISKYQEERKSKRFPE